MGRMLAVKWHKKLEWRDATEQEGFPGNQSLSQFSASPLLHGFRLGIFGLSFNHDLKIDRYLKTRWRFGDRFLFPFTINSHHQTHITKHIKLTSLLNLAHWELKAKRST